MAFTTLDQIGGRWQSPDFLSELVRAYNERLSVQDAYYLDGVIDEFTDPDGRNLQEFFGGRYPQLRRLVDDFMWYAGNGSFTPNFHADGSPVDPAGFSGTAIGNNAGIRKWEEPDFYKVLTGNAGGWRRYLTHPTEGGQAIHGQPAAGEILDHWIFEDLHKAFSLLLWTMAFIDFPSDDSAHPPGSTRYSVKGRGATIAEAHAQALDQWPPEPAGLQSGDARGSYAAISHDVGFGYDVILYRIRAPLQVITPGVEGSAVRALWYVGADTYGGGQWSAQGDPVMRGQLNLFTTTDHTLTDQLPPSPLGYSYSPRFFITSPRFTSTLDPPPDLPDTSQVDPNNDFLLYRGYQLYQSQALLRWDVPGGFEFTGDA